VTSLSTGGAAPAGVVQATWCATLVDEWVRCGVRHAVLGAGSRSTPLALALAAEERMTLHIRLDERSGGFWALGLALATGVPTVVLVTSGTAAAELHPAVVEAHHARVPLLVCTADRPPELHHVGAPQTIDQHGIFGTAVRFACDPGVPDAATATAWRSLASRVVAEALDHPAGPGPVHLNLPFRDPLVARPGPLPPGRPGGAPWHRAGGPGAPPAGGAWLDPVQLGLADESGTPREGIVVAGAGCGPWNAVGSLARALGWPLLADPRSGCRRPIPGVRVVAAADALLRDDDLRRHLQPRAVVRLGVPWASSVLASFLDSLEPEIPQILVGPHWAWNDPGHRVATVVGAEPGAWCQGLASLVERPASPEWSARWGAAEDAAEVVLAGELDDVDRPLSEPALARALWGDLPEEGTLFLASSMPVRDTEWFAGLRPDPPAVVANRGANGIDGVVSTALGLAAGRRGPVVALVGDLAFLHDLTAWLRPPGPLPPLVVVVADNGGGGIFSFLSQADHLDRARFEHLFATPQAVDVARAATGLGIPVTEVATARQLRAALDLGGAGPGVLRVRLPARAENVALHRQLHEAVASAALRALR
jgi:2-succinyl-5-enolpyruvyl-6-hydroxy-3-cyclohexene-1-carboxylate synthase